MPDFFALPEEMQISILESCDPHTLATLCRTSRLMNGKSLPLLWSHIDFEDTDVHDGPQWEFLKTCDALSRDEPQRWASLAPLVRSLIFLRMPGMMLPQKPTSVDFIWGGPGDRSVYDVIAQFPNLEKLSLFIKDYMYETDDFEDFAPTLEASLTRLRDVKLGGEMPPAILRALLAKAEQIEHLALINLIYMAGQDHGPEAVLFLKPLAPRFTHLTSLHLSKLAEFDEDAWVAGLRWDWDVDDECAQLEEWAHLLRHVSSTLVTLRLENWYHVNDREFEDDMRSAEDLRAFMWRCGEGSSDRCRRILFPAIAGNDWPKLKEVTLSGIRVGDGSGLQNPFEAMRPTVKVEYLPGGLVNFTDDATPINISPPPGFFDAW